VLTALRRLERLRGKRGYASALQFFVASQRGLAVAFARRWTGKGAEREDVLQAAQLGLCVAASRWTEAASNGGWTSYAIACMRYEVQTEVRLAQAMPPSHHAAQALSALAGLPEGLTDEEAADRAGVRLSLVRVARQTPRRVAADLSRLDLRDEGAERDALLRTGDREGLLRAALDLGVAPWDLARVVAAYRPALLWMVAPGVWGGRTGRGEQMGLFGSDV